MNTILFLENGTTGGGSFESLRQIVTNLDTAKWRPLVVFVNQTRFVGLLREHGIEVIVLKNPLYSSGKRSFFSRVLTRLFFEIQKSIPRLFIFCERLIHPSAIREIRRLIRDHEVALVHTNNHSVRDLYGLIAAKQEGVKCLSHLRSARTQAVPDHVADWLSRNVDLFIANSEFAKSHWAELGIRAEKIRVVLNAIEASETKVLDVRAEFGLESNSKFVIACVGNFSEGKGHEFLLRAFACALKSEPSITLLLVGDGSRRKALTELADELGIRDRVTMCGYSDRAQDIVAASDLRVLPSKTETFGRVLLEAMQVGTPIVATRVGGVPEVVKHEQSGLLSDYGDVQGFTGAIIRVLRDETLRLRLIEEGRARVRVRFGIDEHMRQIHEEYDKLPSEIPNHKVRAKRMDTSRLKKQLNQLYALPPKQSIRKIKEKLSGKSDQRIFSPALLEENPKYTQPQRMTNFLMRYEKIVSRQLPGWRLELEGKRVLEIGGGPMFGFGLACLFRGAEKYFLIEPEFNSALKTHPKAEHFFWLTHKDLTALYGARMSYNEFRRAIDEKIRVYPVLIENFREEQGIDVMLSNSTLEHLSDLDAAFARLRACASENCQFLHAVDFGNHRDAMNPLGGLYGAKPAAYRQMHGTMINLKRASDILRAFNRYDLPAQMVPYYSVDNLPEPVDPWWQDRYSQDELLLKVGFFVDKRACAS